MEYVYTVQEVVKLLKININAVYSLINSGHLKVIKYGRVKVPAFEIEDFLRRNLNKDLSDLENIVDYIKKDNISPEHKI